MPSIEQLQKIANRLRIHSLRMTTKAGSGHPTTCLSMAELMACLFFDEMQYDIKNPYGFNNDEFVLSKGHAAPILWACYAEAGIIEEEKLMNLRRITSTLEGHPTPLMPWVKAATGSLGQGLSIGAGLACAAKMDHSGSRVYVLLGDGECAEGNVWEAANTAFYYLLDNLCVIVDVNRLGQSRETLHGHDIDPYIKKFEAFGWNAIGIDGHSIPQILCALRNARKNKKPTAIVAKTFKGYGVTFLKDKEGWHGKALQPDQLEKALDELGPMPKINAKSFVKKPRPKKQKKLKQVFVLPKKTYPLNTLFTTREAYGHALLALGKINHAVVSIDGDVKNSSYAEEFFKKYPGRSFQSFIAEQNMVGMGIGLSARGYIPFIATFACFLCRAHDQIRMAAYSRTNTKFVGSHVGVSIGEDGPSQMGLEDLAMFRTIPDCLILYPSDAYSTRACVEIMAKQKGISYLRTTRTKTPIIYKKSDTFRIGGSKVIRKSKKDTVTIIAAGITVHNSLKAYEELKKDGIFIRIVDAYSIKPIDKRGIINSLIETKNSVIVVEDHFERGGLGDEVKSILPSTAKMIHLCIKKLPRSGKSEELMDRYGISKKQVIKAVKKLIIT
jgi:transketolase